jgi:molybdate transport system substrate-binding protein
LPILARCVVALAALAAGLLPGLAGAGEVRVAVAANFTDAAREIAAAFTAQTGHQAAMSFGSTGQLYAQISQGAPFEVFLAADAARPQKALEEGFAVEGTDFTYAVGRIVLWSADAGLVTGGETLRAAGFDRIAIANPVTAPYGAAAAEAMKALGVFDALRAKFVQGNNIAQTFQFVQTGNAELGFVAASQIAGSEAGSRWQVPAGLHAPIRQDAVLLKRGGDNAAARAFLDFLRGPVAAAVIGKYGYATQSGS